MVSQAYSGIFRILMVFLFQSSMFLGSAIGQSGELGALLLTCIPIRYGFAPHQRRSLFRSGGCAKLYESMWSGCRRVDRVVSHAYSGMSRYVLAFLHLRQPSSLLHLGKGDLGSMV